MTTSEETIIEEIEANSMEIEEKEFEEANTLDDCGCDDTIYCYPTCESCGADEGNCDYDCMKIEDLPTEYEPPEPDYEPSAEFCWTHKIDCGEEWQKEDIWIRQLD